MTRLAALATLALLAGCVSIPTGGGVTTTGKDGTSITVGCAITVGTFGACSAPELPGWRSTTGNGGTSCAATAAGGCAGGWATGCGGVTTTGSDGASITVGCATTVGTFGACKAPGLPG